MNNVMIKIEVPEGEVGEILKELTKAQDVILDCYNRLERLGVLTVVAKEATSCN